MTKSEDRPRRLVHFTPLRYPGGKGKLAAYVKSLILANDLSDGCYVEPYAGGAGIALELLMQEYVSRIFINDVSVLVHAFWSAALNETDALCQLIVDTPRTVEAWDRQKTVLMNAKSHSTLEVGFATFFLNRTNRSGILNGGIIGGRDQSGPWKIDARYNAPELVARIEAIANLASRIVISNDDAADFIASGANRWPSRTLVYLDPPYYVKGRELYYDFYRHEDHLDIARIVQEKLKIQKWIVSYDNVPEIRSLYSDRRRTIYDIGYSARATKKGSEVMFFCDHMNISPLVGAVHATEEANLERLSA